MKGVNVLASWALIVNHSFVQRGTKAWPIPSEPSHPIPCAQMDGQNHGRRHVRALTRGFGLAWGLVWGLLLACLAQAVCSEEDATWVSADARLVTFEYDAERTYLVLTRPKVVTHVQLAEDETVNTLVVGDTANFSVVLSANRRHVLIRPKYDGLTTSVTLITNAREYPLILRSTKEGTGKWYQRVSWNTPLLRLDEAPEYSAHGLAVLPQKASLRGLGALQALQPSQTSERLDATEPIVQHSSPSRRVHLDLIRTNYLIEGHADFKPLSVFDDGDKTFIRLPDHYQNFPAVFAWNAGLTQLVNYSVEVHYIVVQGVHAGLMLKLGDAEVKITKEVKHASSWFGSGR
jgi:type IV secretion system protein VirB9